MKAAVILVVLALAGCALPLGTPDANFNACLAMGGAPSYTMAGRDVVKFECTRYAPPQN